MERQTEEDRADFIREAIIDHESSPMFKIGQNAGQFYRGVNQRLENLKNYIYDIDGKAYEDKISPDYKLTANFFYLFTTQLIAWLLGNGISFDNPEVKEALGGQEFDYKVQEILAFAACDGEGYGIVTDGGVVPLCFACKINGNDPLGIPLYDEDDGKMKAVIRYWRLDPVHPLRATLYEEDGYTEYKERDDKTLSLYAEKRPYRASTLSNASQGDYMTIADNYNGLPVVPMGFINHQSSIAGKEETLFAYDLVLSSMVNDVDLNKVYWKVKNADGMDKYDDMNLLVDIYRSHVVHESNGIEVEKEELASSTTSYDSVLTTLSDRLYTDFQAVDVRNLSSGNKTTVEIQSAYDNLNRKCDEVEKYVAKFVYGCMEVLGFDPKEESFHFQRPKEINTSEFITMLLQVSSHLGDETTTKLICESLGLIDEYENIMKKKEAEELDMFSGSDSTEKVDNIIKRIVDGVIDGIKKIFKTSRNNNDGDE